MYSDEQVEQLKDLLEVHYDLNKRQYKEAQRLNDLKPKDFDSYSYWTGSIQAVSTIVDRVALILFPDSKIDQLRFISKVKDA